jgi:hypothetical protein
MGPHCRTVHRNHCLSPCCFKYRPAALLSLTRVLNAIEGARSKSGQGCQQEVTQLVIQALCQPLPQLYRRQARRTA